MRVLLTGSFGWLGQFLAPRLRAAGHVAIGLDVVPGAEALRPGLIRQRRLLAHARKRAGVGICTPAGSRERTQSDPLEFGHNPIEPLAGEPAAAQCSTKVGPIQNRDAYRDHLCGVLPHQYRAPVLRSPARYRLGIGRLRPAHLHLAPVDRSGQQRDGPSDGSALVEPGHCDGNRSLGIATIRLWARRPSRAALT